MTLNLNKILTYKNFIIIKLNKNLQIKKFENISKIANLKCMIKNL